MSMDSRRRNAQLAQENRADRSIQHRDEECRYWQFVVGNGGVGFNGAAHVALEVVWLENSFPPLQSIA